MRKIEKYSRKIFLIFIFTAVFGLGFFAFSSEAQAVDPKCSDRIDNDNDGKIDYGAGANNDSDCISSFDQSENSGHPFLIMAEDMYPELRARANQSPWKEMKAKAISNCLNLNYPATSGVPGDANSYSRVSDKSHKMMKIMSGCSLAYILESNIATAQTYADKIKDTLWKWRDLNEELSCSGCSAWEYKVPPGSAFVNSVVALDIIYNTVSPQDVISFENSYRLGGAWSRFGWPHNGYGTKVVWKIYKNDKAKIEEYKNLYLEELIGPSQREGGVGHISPDGAYPDGPNYASCRLGGSGDRASGKVHSIDIMAFTGVHDFYGVERMKKFYDWLFHMGLNPFKSMQIFGDTGVKVRDDGYRKLGGFYSLDRWSDELSRYASWLIEETDAPYEQQILFAYVLMDKPLAEEEKPKSKIFPDGGAAFWEDSPSENSLAGSVLSTTYDNGFHSHQETNSIYLAGFGEHLIMNSGYFSVPTTDKCIPSTGGNFTRSSCIVANGASTVQINNGGHDYQQKNGNGISEGFVNQYFDYASADSGASLYGGHHQRNFIFIHPEGEKNNGYFVLIDEVKATVAGAKANVLIRPNTHRINTIADKLKYEAPITGGSAATMDIGGSIRDSVEGAFRFDKSNAVVLDVFLGTEPAAVSFKDGMFARLGYCTGGKYIQSDYVTDANGKKNIVTVLFPGDNTHVKAPMSRIVGTNYSGAEISHSPTIKDYAIESSSASSITYNGVSFQGLASMYRINNNENEFYFVRKGKEFNDGKANKKGFTSNNPVSVYLKDKTGKIIVPDGGANVTFYYPGISGVKINGEANQSSVNILAGTYDVELLTGVVPNSADINSNGTVNSQDIMLCVNVILEIVTFPPIEPAVIAKAKAVVVDDPENVCNSQDLMAIVNEILGGG